MRGEREGCARRVAVLAGRGALLVVRIDGRRVEAVAERNARIAAAAACPRATPCVFAGPFGIAAERGRVVRFHAGDAGLMQSAGRKNENEPSTGTRTSRAAAATAASGDVPGAAPKVRCVRARATVDAVQGVMDRHVHHRVHACFLRPVATEEARRDQASPAFAFQAMTAFGPDAGAEAVAPARNTPTARHTARTSSRILMVPYSSPDGPTPTARNGVERSPLSRKRGLRVDSASRRRTRSRPPEHGMLRSFAAIVSRMATEVSVRLGRYGVDAGCRPARGTRSSGSSSGSRAPRPTTGPDRACRRS